MYKNCQFLRGKWPANESDVEKLQENESLRRIVIGERQPAGRAANSRRARANNFHFWRRMAQ
jgi:hypothetical protein